MRSVVLYTLMSLDGVAQSPDDFILDWDDRLDANLAEVIAAARAGHDVIMTPGNRTYLDKYQSRDTVAEPIAIGGWLPPGASVNALHTAVYFRGHQHLWPFLVLVLWSVVSIAVYLFERRVRGHATSRTAATADIGAA